MKHSRLVSKLLAHSSPDIYTLLVKHNHWRDALIIQKCMKLHFASTDFGTLYNGGTNNWVLLIDIQ